MIFSKERFFKEGSYQIRSYRFWYKPTGYHGRHRQCQVEMVVDHGIYLHTITNALWCLLYICEELAPERYAYIESIQQHFKLLNDDDEGLIRVLEDENFDFLWLIGLYLDQLEPSDMLHPPVPADQQPKFEPSINEHINLGDGLCDTYFMAASEILYKRLAKLHELDKEAQEKFEDLLQAHAYSLGKNSANMVWLAEGYAQPNEVQQEALQEFEPEGRRKQIEKYCRERGDENPPFTTEVLGWEDWWELTGSNDANVFVRYTTDDGEGYWQIGFSYLRNEAYLHFPDIYRRIEELEAEQPQHLKMEQPVVAALLAEGWDLTAVAHSHSLRYCDVKGPVIWERVAKENGHKRFDEYSEYLERLQTKQPPDDRVKWLQVCTKLETEVVDAWMAILHEECAVVFSEGIDYRIRAWAVQEVMVNASNFFSDFRDDFEGLFEG